MGEKSYTIRNARFSDAGEIFDLIRRHPDELVMRSKNDILQNIDRFLVGEIDGAVAGIVSWSILPELDAAKHPSVEMKTLAVDRPARGTGMGRALVETAMERIRRLNPEQIIVLTFSPKFFRKFGFREVAKEKLMHKLYTGCLNCTRFDNPFTCPEIAMNLVLNRKENDRSEAG